MPLAENLDFQPEYKQIDYKGKPLGTFRGLTYTDLMVLVRDNLKPMQQAVRDIAPGGQVEKILHGQSIPQIALACVATNPDLAAKIMALATDEPDAIETMRKLPFALAINVMSEIIRMTLEDVGGPLGLSLAVVRLVTGHDLKLGDWLKSWLETMRLNLAENPNLPLNPSLASIEVSGTA